MGMFSAPKQQMGEAEVQEMEAKKDVRGLLRALKYKDDPYVRQKAAQALGNIGDPKTVEPSA